MPKINPSIMIWARETAGLTREEAAKKLGFRDTRRGAAGDTLATLEDGTKEPTRPQLVKMARAYRRPLLTFYLSKPPRKGNRGGDFRTLPHEHSQGNEALLDALLRDIWARQGMVRAVLEDEDEVEPLGFIGAHRIADGKESVLTSLRELLNIDLETYRDEPNAASAFDLLREQAERAGIFVLIKGDLGNYRTAIDLTTFRGFSISENVAPFIVINDHDAKAAWSFTLLHEMVHLLLGQTGVSGVSTEKDLERFCDDVAGEFLLPANEAKSFSLSNESNLNETMGQISQFADERNISRAMVAYKIWRSGVIDRENYNRISSAFRKQWEQERERSRERMRAQESGPSYYVVRRHRLGDGLINLVRHMMAVKALSTSKGAKILGIKPRQVEVLFKRADGIGG